MGNTASNAAGQQRQTVQDSSKQGSKSWATTDHTISGPWSFIVKEHVQCLCEGGKSCTREDPARQKGANAVPGLHSNWVGEHVLAMARPWQENVAKYDLVSKFKDLNIGMILNLQEVGEHDSCGPGNLPSSGFTYNPESFMAAKIGFYNLSWRDMGVPTLDKMMDIVQVMHYATNVEKKKIAVHCHAGLGRTGLAIACFMVANGEASAAQAVEIVRQQRPGALQTSAQVVFVSIFEQYLQHLRCLFKVADLRQISLGNEGYILTKVCRRISRSMSAHGASIADPVAAAAAALSSISSSGSTGNLPLLASSNSAAVGSDRSGKLKAAAMLPTCCDSTGAGSGTARADAALDWASASYGAMSAAEASQVVPTAEAAANAALNLGSNASEGVMMHARRLSGGGGSMKLVCNLKAIKEETDKPVHVIETESAVTEVYGHGLTIIRSAQSTRRLQSVGASQRALTAITASPEQQLLDRLPTASDLGLESPTPWNEKFHIKPEAFTAEGWLPEAPSSYLEALKRQQRTLHGLERRQSLRLHRLLKAAAKALAKAADAYNEVPEHWDTRPSNSGGTATQPASPLRRMHSRSRSSAAAEMLAITAALGSSGGGGISASGSNSSSAPGTPTRSAVGAGAAPTFGVVAGSTQLGPAMLAGDASCLSGVPLLPGIYLGAPGTSSACSRRASTGCSSGSPACLAGCCAPSFAAGLLVALLYKGRYPEELEGQWSLCPRLQTLGLGEGHAVCAQLQSVKLALNSGDFQPLETASAAVALVVLGDWFVGFTSEALSEASLELLLDEAEELLRDALQAAAHRQVMPLQHQQGSNSDGASSERIAAVRPGEDDIHGQCTLQRTAEPFEELDDFMLSRKAAARAVCCALAAHEQDLFLLMAAVLRHARHASLDDARLQIGTPSRGSSDSCCGSSMSGSGGVDGTHQQQQQQQQGHTVPPAAVVEAEVHAAMAALYRIVAAWLLGPLAVACGPALEATAAFLHYLTVDDVGYSQLLQASREQGLKKAHSQATNHSSDSMESLLTGTATPETPRSQLRSRMLSSALAAGLVKAAGDGGAGSGGGGGGAATGQGKGKKKKSKLNHSSSSPSQLAGLQGTAADSFPEGFSSKSSKEPSPKGLEKHTCPGGCGENLGSMLVNKFHAKIKLQLPGIGVSAHKRAGAAAAGSKEGEPQGLPAAASEGKSQHKQQQQQQQPASRPLAADSVVGDHSSQLVESGQRELCVGYKERTAASTAADLAAELAELTCRQEQQQQLQPRSEQQQEAGLLDLSGEGAEHGSMMTPLCSVSPATSPTPPTAARSSVNVRQPHHHLPAIRPSTAAAAAAVAVAAGPPMPGSSISPNISPLSSGQFAPGQLGGAAAPGWQQQQQQQQVTQPSNAFTSGGGGSDCAMPAAAGCTRTHCSGSNVSNAVGYAAGYAGVQYGGAAGQLVSAVPSSIDLAASQMLSASMLSDIQLPSFASNMSVAESIVVAQSRPSWDNFSGMMGSGLQASSRSTPVPEVGK